jgi:threonine aldolase
MKKIIDLRSDTVTKPSEDMRKEMYNAEVGDDVYKEDPTVNKLEEFVADLLGKEAALFVPSGLMGNQICLNVLTSRGDEVICERNAHIFQYESGTPAALSGLQLSLVSGVNGVFTPEQVEPLIRPESAYYMPRTKVIEIENTHNVAGGTINPISNIRAMQELSDKYGIFMHLDGARLWNASVATGITLSDYASYFDSLSVCLSKGLGAPIGSVIASTDGFIKEAYRVRKAWGGGMRQVGVIAAAGLYAVKNNISRLSEDHDNAKTLADFINSMDNMEIDLDNVETNIVVFKPKDYTIEDVIHRCKEKGLLLGPGGFGTIRAVTHMDVNRNDIVNAIEILSTSIN